MVRRKPIWQRLTSGLYVPPLLGLGNPWPCSGCCECPGCYDCDVAPGECASATSQCILYLTLSDAAEDTCPDSLCGTLDGTYALCMVGAGPGTCHWRYTFDPAICDVTRIEFRLSNRGSGTAWEGGHLYAGLLEVARWLTSSAVAPDCGAYSTYNLPFHQHYNSPKCDLSGSTMTVSSTL